MIPQDPIILLSYINTKLRDHYATLDQLCEDMNIDRSELTEKLKAIEYDYDENRNQFV